MFVFCFLEPKLKLDEILREKEIQTSSNIDGDERKKEKNYCIFFVSHNSSLGLPIL